MPEELSNGAIRTDLSVPAAAGAWLRLSQSGAGFFGPGQPLTPVTGAGYSGDEAPRMFQYTPGVNLVTVPRAGFGLASFPVLRNLAAGCKEIRLNIELIKREVRALDWEITPVEKDGDASGLEEIKAWVQKPDGVQEFDTWINAVLEEVLVTDALSLFFNDADGRLKLEAIDGATIRPLLTYRGQTPAPPLPAYTQVLYGIPASWYALDRLMYRPFNSAVNSPYGTSPTEFIITAVNLAMRYDLARIGYFTDGNIPGAFVKAPKEWTPEQIKQYHEYMEAIMKGDLTRAYKLMFIPGGEGTSVYEFQRNDVTNTGLDTWLMQVACWAFGNSPAEFGIIPGQGLGGAGFMQGMADIQYRSILAPLTQFLAGILNSVISTRLKRPNIKFGWKGLEPQKNELQQAQVDQVYIASSVYTVGYVQDRLNIPPEFRGSGPLAQPSPSILSMGGQQPSAEFFRRYSYP